MKCLTVTNSIQNTKTRSSSGPVWRLIILCILAAVVPGTRGAAQNSNSDSISKSGDQTGIVHNRRQISGIPIGGIGTGSFEVMTDGSVSHSTINDNRAHPSGDLPGCFAAIWTSVGAQRSAIALTLQNSYKIPGARGVDFDGLYPKAKMIFSDPALPIAVNLTVFSPIIPSDARNSSFPGGVYLFHLTNSGTAQVEASIALSWENTLGIGGSDSGAAFKNRSGNVVAPIPSEEGFFGLSFSGSSVRSQDGNPVRSLNNTMGNMTLMAYPERPEATVTTAAWNSLSPHPDWWESFQEKGIISGTVVSGIDGTVHPAGVLAVKISLKPRESVDIPFAVTWYTPHLNAQVAKDRGHYYQNFFTGSSQVAHALLSEWRGLYTLTGEWQNRLLFSNMPRNIVRAIIDSASPLSTNTIHAFDGSFAIMENGEFASTSKNLAVSALILDFYPDLFRRELDNYAAAQKPDGSFPTSFGSLSRATSFSTSNQISLPIKPAALLIGPQPEATDIASLNDSCSYLLQMSQYVSRTGDKDFLNRHLPDIRRAVPLALRRQNMQLASDPWNISRLAEERLYLAALYSSRQMLQSAIDQPLSGFPFYGDAVDMNIFVTRMYSRNADIKLAKQISDRITTELPEAAVKLGAENFPTDAFDLILPYAFDPTHSEMQNIIWKILNGKPDEGLEEFQKLEKAHESANLSAPVGSKQNADDLVSYNRKLDRAAGWNLLAALEGFNINLEKGRLDLSTNIPGTWRTLLAPIYSSTFWGRIEFKPTAKGGIITFRLDRLLAPSSTGTFKRMPSRAALLIRELRIPGAPPRLGIPTEPPIAHVSRGQSPLGARSRTDMSGDIILTLDTPLLMAAGDRLQVDLH